MSHFGVVAPPYYSHFQALQALAGQLLERGHRVTFFHQADAARWLSDPRIGFCPVGLATHPAGSLQRTLRRAAHPTSPWGLRQIIVELGTTTAMLCAQLPQALAAHGVDALICDQMEAAGGLVGESLGLPFVSVACALPINREPGLPLPVMPFAYGTEARQLQMYQGSTRVYDWLMGPLGQQIHKACQTLGIAPRDALHDCLSPLAQISQTVTSFDFPRRALPPHFHAVGPLRVPEAAAQGAWPIDPTRAFVFASLGTLQGERMAMFQRIAQACQRLDTQLLIAHCGHLNSAQERRLVARGASWVTDFAPQQWAIERADAVVTHGGLNTVLDAIAHRTPMLVMPIAFDQPGVAARVSYRRVGVHLSRHARAGRIGESLKGLLTMPMPGFEPMTAELQRCGGAATAAAIVEQAVAARRPVMAGACL
ncbi:glycosyltransferase [Pseudomonas sp. UBA4194]|uniref:glycosyltransferase n=1 Tax=Pseudomonas sp. UBA4194 TaxID=1947317 RepID=UPI0026002956|nr:glycosyltransferase [Pseudomonas sp. UBA4194]